MCSVTSDVSHALTQMPLSNYTFPTFSGRRGLVGKQEQSASISRRSDGCRSFNGTPSRAAAAALTSKWVFSCARLCAPVSRGACLNNCEIITSVLLLRLRLRCHGNGNPLLMRLSPGFAAHKDAERRQDYGLPAVVEIKPNERDAALILFINKYVIETSSTLLWLLSINFNFPSIC